MEKTKKHAPSAPSVPRPFFNPSDFAVFDQANEAIFLHHGHTGAIVTLNGKACEMFGYASDDVRRLSIVTMPPGEYPYTAEEALRRFREAAAGNPQVFEWKTRNQAGREFWVEGYLKGVVIGDHDFVLATFRDITRRKISEQRLSLEHGSLTLLQDTAREVLDKLDEDELLVALVHRAGLLVGTSLGFVYLYDEGADRLELKVPAVGGHLNQEVKPGEGLVGKVWQSGEPAVEQSFRPIKPDQPESREAELATLAVPLRRGSKVLGVLGLYSPEEDYHFREDEVALLSRFADLAAVAVANAAEHSALRKAMTASKATEAALRLSEERYRLLFNSIHDIIYIADITADGQTGLIIDANETACKRLGYAREELLTKTPADIIPLEFRGDTREKIELLYAHKHTTNESAYLTSDNQTIPVEVNSHLVYLDERPCVVSISRDISERKRVEKEIARLDRLNLIGAMAAGIGHEIRNPLTTVRGFLQMLGTKEDFSRHRSHFDLMIQELDRANSIITEFLSLAKNKAVDLREGSLNTIVSMLLPLLEAGAILYNKTVKTELADIPDIPLDEKEIRQLIINLVRNGLDAMPPGGALTIRTTCDDEQVVLSVQDQGKGIPPDVADRIGTPFFSTKEYGVGLGLAVCYSIAARHGASISFESETNGTTFNVHFPLRG
jgi:PAS domain S-box-containing protein